MVRNYVRKTRRQNWDKDNMKAAIESIVIKKYGYKKAALQFGVAKSTLERRVAASNEGWICCCSCKQWAHCSCAGVKDDNSIIAYTCDLCIE